MKAAALSVFEPRTFRIRIDKAAPAPVYVQIADSLRSALVSAPAGTMLPPERVLCEHYSVSRMTLRQAFGVLEREGLLASERGRGTFVAPERVRKQQQEMRSFSEELKARGARVTSHVLSFGLLPGKPDSLKQFGLAAGARIWYLERVRLSDGVPLALEKVRIPQEFTPGLDRFDFGRASLYQTLEEHYRLQLTMCVEEIQAISPTAAHRRLLRVPPAAAVLLVERKSYSPDGDLVEMAETAFRGDLYRALVRSTRKAR